MENDDTREFRSDDRTQAMIDVEFWTMICCNYKNDEIEKLQFAATFLP